MRGRTAIVLGVVIATLTWFDSTPASAASEVTGRGDVRCEGILRWRGQQVAYHVLLTPRADGATTTVGVTGTLTCTGTTGDPRTGVKKVRVASLIRRTWECVFDSVLEGVQPHPWEFALNWAPQRLADTRVTFTNSKGAQRNNTTGVTTTSITWPGSPEGTSNVTGSYAGTGTASLFMLFDRLSTYVFTDWCHHSHFPHKGAKGKVFAVLTV